MFYARMKTLHLQVKHTMIEDNAGFTHNQEKIDYFQNLKNLISI